jgi:hypothetical protein
MKLGLPHARALVSRKHLEQGIDITAGVITSTLSAFIIAVITTFTWGFKRKRDLKLEADKQRQQHRLALELAAEQLTNEAAERRARVRQEVGDLIVPLERVVHYGHREGLDHICDARDANFLPLTRKAGNPA